MLAAGLRELFILGEDYVSMVACEDEIDVALLTVLREAGAAACMHKVSSKKPPPMWMACCPVIVLVRSIFG